MARVLAEQVDVRNKQRDLEKADRAAVAKQYRSDAESLLQAEAAAKIARAERKRAVHDDLNRQLDEFHGRAEARPQADTGSSPAAGRGGAVFTKTKRGGRGNPNRPSQRSKRR